ncbi:MAG: hypothetical protein K9K30_04885 [Burkholderiaceae bacterium]|nr:hypothetical protein [Sulfuritalea sp.]MCF8174560.1 hypothetical protein [Burkholderiaceae bacterium]
MKPVTSLFIPTRPSHRLLLILSIAHIVAAGAVLAAALPAWLTVALLAAIGISLVNLRRVSPAPGLVLRSDGQMEIVGADGTASEAQIHSHTLVLSFLVVLLFRQSSSLRSITLLADSLAAEDFRQLRLWLRWRATASRPL